MTANKSLSTLPDLDEVYKNLLTAFDPASKRVLQAGRELWRAWIAVSEATKAYADALDRLGVAGSNCGGETKEIGQCLLQISETLKELHKHEKNTIQFYETQVLVPTDANLDQDSKVLIEQRRNFEKKLKQLGDRVKRDRKKGVPTEESERMFRDYQADCVKQALTEEKKRYTYMLDRHCALATWQIQFYRNALSLYEQNIQKWKDACVNPEELSAAALAALDAAIQPYGTQSSVSTVSRPDIRAMNTETDAISNSLPPMPLVREQGVGTFHINEGESVKATLDAAKVLLQTQQQQQRLVTVELQNGAVVDRRENGKIYKDPPSTGSSTLSNGSRHGMTPEPVVNGTASMGSLVKKSESPIQVIAVSPGAPSQGNGTVEYAPIAKPNRQSMVVTKSETVSLSPGLISVTNQTSPGASERRRTVALFSYNNAGSNQLAFQEGDIILVIQDGQQGWRFGENVSTGKRGWYPASFTRPEAESPGPPQPRPRAQSSSATRNGGHNGHNSHNGNGVTHSSSITNGDIPLHGKTAPAAPKQSPRPVSMMVIQHSNPATPPTYRPAPPPPAPPPPPEMTSLENGGPIVYVDENQDKDLHMVNYDTMPKHNPFSHVRLRHVVKTDGTPKKYG